MLNTWYKEFIKIINFVYNLPKQFMGYCKEYEANYKIVVHFKAKVANEWGISKEIAWTSS